MVKNKHITVCIPCYPKHTKFLESCLKSIENQILKPKIVFIGHSEMNNKEKNKLEIQLNHFTFPIKIINTKEKKSAGENRNRCVKFCKTKYISFFDADDIMFPNRLLEIWNIIEKYSPECVLHSYSNSLNKKTTDGNLKIYKRNDIYKAAKNTEKYFLSLNKIIDNKNMPMGHLTVSKKIFDKIKFTEDALYEDAIFLRKIINLYKSNNSIIFLPKKLSFYKNSNIHFLIKLIKTKKKKNIKYIINKYFLHTELSKDFSN